jgi:hypothetical protein
MLHACFQYFTLDSWFSYMSLLAENRLAQKIAPLFLGGHIK